MGNSQTHVNAAVYNGNTNCVTVVLCVCVREWVYESLNVFYCTSHNQKPNNKLAYRYRIVDFKRFSNTKLFGRLINYDYFNAQHIYLLSNYVPKNRCYYNILY